MQQAVGLLPSSLEIQLKGRQFSITEKQQRLLADLKQLRNLLYKVMNRIILFDIFHFFICSVYDITAGILQAEELDPITLYCCLNEVRNNKDVSFTINSKKVKMCWSGNCSHNSIDSLLKSIIVSEVFL